MQCSFCQLCAIYIWKFPGANDDLTNFCEFQPKTTNLQYNFQLEQYITILKKWMYVFAEMSVLVLKLLTFYNIA